MLRKIFLCPYFGEFPAWFTEYREHIKQLERYGYDFLITSDLDDFKRRVKDKLGIDCPVIPGTGKVHDYRPALGLLYEEEIQGYDYWGHTDFDCCYGRIDRFMPNEQLAELDIWSNHVDYICGPWTLYRNDQKIILFFERYPQWREILSQPETTGWAEFQAGFTGVVDKAHADGDINRLYTMWQTKDLNDFSTVRFVDGILIEGQTEIMMAHFRRKKEWPL